MGLFDIFRKQQPAAETKESAAAQTWVVNPGEAVWTDREYAKFADEGYRRNVVAYQAINKICEAIALPKPLLFRGETEVTESPLLDLMRKPNPVMDFDSYVSAFVGFYLLSGNGYQEKVLVGNEPRELYPLRSDRMKVIPSNTGFPSGFEYQVGGRKHRWDFDAENVLASPVWQTKAFNPLDDWYGLSPIEAGAYSVDQHNEAMKWMQALLQNSARPSGALIHKGENGAQLSDDQFNRLKLEMQNSYQGSQNAGKPMLLEGGLDWKQMGLSPTDMGIIESKYSSARDICLAFGVPPQLLGIPGDNTYSNYQEARLAFWEDTVIPLLGTVYGSWNTWLAPHFGDGLELRPDLDTIPAIVDKRMSLWQMADQSQDLTINERRELKGYERIEGGDTLMVPANLLPLDFADGGMGAMDDAKAAAKIAGYGENVTPIDRKAK